jgi:hypothetical protein
MPDAGFRISLPVSQMTGNCVLGLARLNKGRIPHENSLATLRQCGRSVQSAHVREIRERWARCVGIIPSASLLAEVCEED